MINLPIIVYYTGGGDIDIYESVDKALCSMEAIDVKNGEYEVYDAEGFPLLLSTDLVLPRPFFFFQIIPSANIKIEANPNARPEKEKLIGFMIDYLETINLSFDETKANDLPHLIERIKTKYKSRWKFFS